MSATVQYLILFGLTAGTVGFVLSLYALARAIGRNRADPGKDVPATAGSQTEQNWIIEPGKR